MSEFANKHFYGFSIKNDPGLKTTTENFKFRYTQPEFLKKAIQKVHDKEDTNNNRKNMMWYDYCRLRKTSAKPLENVGVHTKSNCTDIENQIKTVGPSDTKIVRDLTEREVDNLIGIAKQDASPNKTSTRCCCSSHEEDTSSTTVRDDALCKRILKNKSQFRESKHEEVSCVQTNNRDGINLPLTLNSLTSDETQTLFDCGEQQPTFPQMDYLVLEEYRRPQPKWVEIVEPSKDSCLEIEIKDFYLKSPKPLTPKPQFLDACGYGNFNKASIQMSHSFPDVLMTEVIHDNVQCADKFMNANHCENLENFAIDDSDMEFKELSKRKHFTKYNKSRPDDMFNLSFDDDNDRKAELIGNKSDMSHVKQQQYVRNTSPSHLIDFHNAILQEQSAQNNQIKIFINDLKKQQCPNKHRTSSDSRKTPDLGSPPQKEQKVKRKTKPTLRQKHLQRAFESGITGNGNGNGNGTTNPNSPNDRSIRSSTPEQPQLKNTTRIRSKCVPSDNETHTTGRRSLRHNNLFITKSIEDLKVEKTIIFKKMTTSQEKMIEVLDKLRLSLLELHVPENSYEKTRRQKNAFEFSVRFSRNFLYPLKGMKEDLKLTAAEQFNSLTSNDACNRVCYMYNLLLQSLNTYQKQLRFFLLDHVPQKLTSLIEMIYSSTEICLEKDIFSKQDVVVDCLQQRCLKFLGFLEDFQEGRLQMASKSNRSKLAQEKAHTKYDLKMFMNDLNMYEPKLVPKVIVPDRSAKSKRNKPKRPSNQVLVYDFPDTLLEKPLEDTIPTHVQSLSNNNSNSCLVSSQLDLTSGESLALDRNVIEALQKVTKEQVRQVLKPILDSLGSALGNQNNSEAIEAIINAFNVKVFTTLDTENQHSFDDKYSKEAKTQTIELSSMDCVANTCKSLKAAKQTKTLRQQNSHEALSKKRPSTTSTTGITVDDDNNDIDNKNNNNNNNKHDSNNNANSKSNSNISTSTSTSKRNSTTHLRGAVGGGGDFCGGGGGVFGEYSNQANHMGEQTSMTTTITPNKRVSKKIMNEDQNNNRAGSQSEDIQTTGYQRKDDFQIDISTSDSDDDLNPHCLSKSKNCLKSHDSCPFTQQTTYSQCQLQSITRNSSNLILHHIDSYQSLNSIKTKSRSKKKKRNTLPKSTSANAVTPSSTRNRTDNKDNDSNSIQYQRTNGDEQDIFKPNLSANSPKFVMPLRATSNERDDSEIQFVDQKTNLDCVTDFKLAARNMIPTRLCASYVELHNKRFSPNSPANTPEERTLKDQRSRNTFEPLQSLKSLKETLQPATNSYDQSLFDRILTGEQTYQKDRNENSNANSESKTHLRVDEMVKERDRFLELCSKNRFYRNPNYAEPWKVFSSISESLLNDVLNCVEADFATGVSKFVEDFLQLETKT